MTYQDKIDVILSLGEKYFYQLKIYFLDIPNRGCPPIFINNIKNNYRWISKGYVNYLTKFNGGEFDDIRLFGDENCKNGNVLEIAKELYPFFKNRIPIAKDSAGDIFWLAEDGSVNWMMIDNLGEFDSSKHLTDTFEEFMNEFCLGKKYESWYGENEWVHFLKSQGWV